MKFLNYRDPDGKLGDRLAKGFREQELVEGIPVPGYLRELIQPFLNSSSLACELSRAYKVPKIAPNSGFRRHFSSSLCLRLSE